MQFLGYEAEYKFSNGWYSSFTKWNGFKKITIYRESGDAQMEGIEDCITEFKDKIALYLLSDVYNMNETAYFDNLTLDKIITWQQIEGTKKDKTHITITLTCNASRIDLFQLLILGHTAKLYCFKKKTEKTWVFFI